MTQPSLNAAVEEPAVLAAISRCADALEDVGRLRDEIAGLRSTGTELAGFAAALFDLERARMGDSEARTQMLAVADSLLVFWRAKTGDALADAHPALSPLWAHASTLLASFEGKRFKRALDACWQVRHDAALLTVALSGLTPAGDRRVEFASCLYNLELARLEVATSRGEFARRAGLVHEAYHSKQTAAELVGDDEGLQHLWKELVPYLDEFFEALEDEQERRRELANKKTDPTWVGPEQAPNQVENESTYVGDSPSPEPTEPDGVPLKKDEPTEPRYGVPPHLVKTQPGLEGPSAISLRARAIAARDAADPAQTLKEELPVALDGNPSGVFNLDLDATPARSSPTRAAVESDVLDAVEEVGPVPAEEAAWSSPTRTRVDSDVLEAVDEVVEEPGRPPSLADITPVSAEVPIEPTAVRPPPPPPDFTPVPGRLGGVFTEKTEVRPYPSRPPPPPNTTPVPGRPRNDSGIFDASDLIEESVPLPLPPRPPAPSRPRPPSLDVDPGDYEPDEATQAFWRHTEEALGLLPPADAPRLDRRALSAEGRAERKKLNGWLEGVTRTFDTVPEARAFACLIKLYLAAQQKEKSLFGGSNARRKEAIAAALELLSPEPLAAGHCAVWFELDGPETLGHLQGGLEVLMDFLQFCSRQNVDPLDPGAPAQYLG